jgi:hypothetical protein
LGTVLQFRGARMGAPVPESEPGVQEKQKTEDSDHVRSDWPQRGLRAQPRVLTLGNIESKRFALKGRELTVSFHACIVFYHV